MLRGMFFLPPKKPSACRLPPNLRIECKIELLPQNPRPLQGSTAYVSLRINFFEGVVLSYAYRKCTPLQGSGFLRPR